jgi:hypothetical protein
MRAFAEQGPRQETGCDQYRPKGLGMSKVLNEKDMLIFLS